MLNIIQADLFNSLHADALLDLLDHYARDPMGGGESISDFVREHLVARLQQRHDAMVVLAYEQERAIGLCICFEGFSTFQARPLMNIHDIVVHSDYRGRGVAQQMLQQVEQQAQARGCCKLTLEVLQGNAVAQAAYRRFGFAPYELDPQMGQALFWQKPL